jgi:hypothetical protein
MGRGILAVIVGFMLWGILWVGSNQVLIMALPGVFQPDGSADNTGVLLLLLVLSVVISAVTGYLAALIARQNPTRYVGVLSILLLVVGILVQSQYWNTLPLWYHLGFLALLIPACLFGGRLRLGQFD